MPQQALRHQAGREPQPFDILEKNKDGTVNLGRDGQLVIANCIVSEDGKPGTCTLAKPKRARGGKDEKGDSKAVEAAQLALAEAQKVFAADPSEANGAAVDDARAALEELQE